MKKKIVLGLLATFLAGELSAQTAGRTGNFTYRYDVDGDNSAITCRSIGPIQGSGSVTNTTVTLEATSSTAFTNPVVLAAGDWLVLKTDFSRQLVLVSSVTDGNTLTLVAAPTTDVTGAKFDIMDTQCGTGAEDGWMPFRGSSVGATIGIQIDQYVATGGILVKIEGRGDYPGALPYQIYPDCQSDACDTYQTFDGTAGVVTRDLLVLDEFHGEVRVWLKTGTTDDGDDLTTNMEQVTVGWTRSVEK